MPSHQPGGILELPSREAADTADFFFIETRSPTM